MKPIDVEVVFISGKELVLHLDTKDYNKLTNAFIQKGGIIRVSDDLYGKEFFINVQSISYIGEI